MTKQGRIRLQAGGEEEDTSETDPSHKHGAISNDLSSFFCLISKFPDSILSEIFFRLPIKSVSLCRCVCRAWRRIISEPDFSDCHVKHSNYRPLLYHPCYDLVPRVLLLLQISDNSYEYDCIRTVVDPKIPDWAENQPYFTFRGSCNGFICMLFTTYPAPRSSVAHIYVSNPVTGECIALPVRTVNEKNNWFIAQAYYFGFSPSDNKFKVLGVDTEGGLDRDAEIVTVGVDDKWRSLPSGMFRDLERSFNAIVFCSGMFHWSPSGGYETPGFVSAFDVGEEKLCRFSLPPGFEESRPVLRTFDDQLCVSDFRKSDSITIWVMKEHAVPESWTAIVINRSWIPPEIKLHTFIPVAQLSDGGILFAVPRGNFLLSINVEKKKCSRIEMYVSNPTVRIQDGKTCASNVFHPAKKL